MKQSPISRLVNVTKNYGDNAALEGVSVDIFPGEIVGIVGEMGSGKTTLTSILCGNQSPDSGEVWVANRPVQFASPSDAILCGVRLLPQQIELYPSLSILENIFLGQELTRKLGFPRLMDWKQMEVAARALLARVAVDSIDPNGNVSHLSGGQQKAVILARLLAGKAKVLVFDEPMKSLGGPQQTSLLNIFKIEAASGRSIIFVSHDLEDVFSVCSRIILLREGRIIQDVPIGSADQKSLSKELGIRQS